MMGLYSGNICIRSHQVRFVLSEKGIVTKIDNFDGKKVPEDLIALNPFASLPTLIDRELVLYDSRVIIEYIDERYPYPPLMPVSPVDRAKVRLALASLETDIVIPGNDDAIRSIELITSSIADACLKGSGKRKELSKNEETK